VIQAAVMSVSTEMLARLAVNDAFRPLGTCQVDYETLICFQPYWRIAGGIDSVVRRHAAWSNDLWLHSWNDPHLGGPSAASRCYSATRYRLFLWFSVS